MALLGVVPFAQFGDEGEAKPEALPEPEMPRYRGPAHVSAFYWLSAGRD